MAKFCTNCGTPLNGSPKFCASCGAPVLATQQAPASPSTAVHPQPQAQTVPPTPHQPVMRTPPSAPAAQAPPNAPAMQAPPNAPAQPVQYSAPVPPSPMPQATPYYNPQVQQHVPPYFAYGGEPYIPDEGIAAMFFRYDNRLNRKRYIMRGLIVVGIYIALALVFGFIGSLIDQEVASLMVILVGLVITVPSFMLLIRRLHDLDRPGWWAIGNFIPLVNFALSIYVLFCKGTDGPNQYGPDPLTVTN